MADALAEFAPAGRVLELACGTGWWTEQLARYADTITAVDASPEVLALNRDRVGAERVRHVHADLFTWRPDAVYDVVFFSFWLSHVPPERFGQFLELVRQCLAPGGRVFFVDSLFMPAGSARDQEFGGSEAIVMDRRLNDGRQYRIVKVYYRPDELAARLATLGWEITVQSTTQYFLYGFGRAVAL